MEFLVRLFEGGTFEKIFLLVIIIVAIIVAIILIYLAFKLLILIGKGALAGGRLAGGIIGRRRLAAKEAALTAPARIGTSWDAGRRTSYAKAFRDAAERAHADAYRVLVIAGDGAHELAHGLGTEPPSAATVQVTASDDFILIDASRASKRELGKVLDALPWRRPIDAVAAIISAREIPPHTLNRAAFVARRTGLRVALHLAFETKSPLDVRQVVDAANRDGARICSLLAEDAARAWLGGGPRTGLTVLSEAMTTGLAGSIDRLIAATPSSSVDIASVAFGGAGLRAAVAQTAGRTQPGSRPGLALAGAVLAAVAGAGAAFTGTLSTIEDAESLTDMLQTARREASAPVLSRTNEEQDLLAFPDGGRVLRLAGLGVRLSALSEPRALSPGRLIVPRNGAPTELGAAFLDHYVLKPLANALTVQATDALAPSAATEEWLASAQDVEAWLAAWAGLADEPREVDIPKLFADAFTTAPELWPEGIEMALVETGVQIPDADEGGLDAAAITRMARENFIATMGLWAEERYTNGPVATAARRAMRDGLPWREHHDALRDLKKALEDPGQRWMTAAKDRPESREELRRYARAVALAVLGKTVALSAKAEVSRTRLGARAEAAYFRTASLGPLMSRGGTPGATEGMLALTKATATWLGFLERARAADFTQPNENVRGPIAGAVTVEPGAVARIRSKIESFDRFSSVLPENVPAVMARDLIARIANEIVLSLPEEVEASLRPAPSFARASADALRLARVAPALDEIRAIEEWLAAHNARTQANRVLEIRSRVADEIMEQGLRLLDAEDPLGIEIGNDLDPDLLTRRFERGVKATERLYAQYAEPFLEAGSAAGTMSAFEWESIEADLKGQDKGNDTSTLAQLETLVHAYAADAKALCAERPERRSTSRSDYLARKVERFAEQVERSCNEEERERLQAIYDSLEDYYEREIAWRGPYAADPKAPDVPASTLAQFVARLAAAGGDIERIDGPLAPVFAASVKLWQRTDEGASAIRFRIEWRTRKATEHLGEHLAEIRLDGTTVDEDAIHTWRYGAPAAIVLRLANTSPYRFKEGSDPQGTTFRIEGTGNAALVPLLRRLATGDGTLTARVVDESGREEELRVSARVADSAGATLAFP